MCVCARAARPIGSMSSMEVNVDMLEQMDLTDVCDHEALDVFLNSAADESSHVSAVRGDVSLSADGFHAVTAVFLQRVCPSQLNDQCHLGRSFIQMFLMNHYLMRGIMLNRLSYIFVIFTLFD